MKIKNITTLFILICSLIALTVTGCKNVNISDNSKTTEKTGSITGKAFYSNAQDNSTIQVTLDKTDGLRSAAVLNEAGMYNPDCYEITSSNLRTARTIVSYTPCSEDGSYSFTNLEPGVYTVYAMSQDSREKAVSRNISVVVDGKVVVPDLQLTATGSLSGKITLDNSEADNAGFVVFIAGTSYMAVTGTDGLFTITDIPAKADYQIIVMYGTYTYLWKTGVEVKAFDTVSLGEIDFDSDVVLSGIKGKDGKDGQDGADGAKGDKGDKGDSGKDGTSIIWKGSFSSSDQLKDPQYLWAFFNTTDGCSYIYDGEEWTLLASKGDKGEDGKDAAQYTIRTTEVAADDTNLPDGGIKIEILKDGTVVDTKYISNGSRGETGDAGTSADQYTIRTTEVAAGDTNLPNGGIKLEVLKNGVVQETRYISNGAEGEDGEDADQYSIRTTEITPCEDYPDGGLKIEILKNGTVEDTKYITNGATGPQGLQGDEGAAADQYSIRTTIVEAGDTNLPDGGIKLEVLKNGVVIETRYISNGAAGTDADQYTIRTTAVEPGDTNLPNGGIKLEVIKNNETVVDTKYISKGDKGDQGDRGEEGYHLVWKGSFASSNQILNPQYLWCYYNSTEGCSYIYNGQGWELLTINNDYEDLSIYSVRHLLQNLNDDNYTLAETEQKIGRIGRTTSESPKEYEGFEATPIVQKTVTSDGNTVVEIKYDRKISTIFFDTGDGPALDSITAKFGAPVTAPYYDSIRMEENGEAFYIDRFEPAVPSTMPAESVTCVALWKNIVDLYSNYTVYLYPEPYTVDTFEMFELSYEKGQTLQLPEYDSEHYDFCGWYPEEKVTFNVDEYNIYNIYNINTFSGEPFTEISPDTWLPEWNEYSIIILYAKLEPKQYTITYHNFDSGNDSSYPKTYYYEEYPYIETPERQDNKFFGGWFLDEDFIQRIDFSGHLCTPDTVHTGIGPYDSETVNRNNFNLLNYYGLLGSELLTYGNNYLLYFLTTTSSTHFDGNIDLYAKWNDANEVSVYVNELGSLWSLQSEEFPLTVKLLDDVIDWEEVVKRFKFDYDYGIYSDRNLTDYIILDLSNTTLTEVPSFKDCDLLYGIILPDTVTNIGSSSFHHCSSLTTVYYTGTEEQWNTITIGSENTPLTDATIVYNYTPPQE